MPLSHVLTVYFISLLIVFLPSFGLAKMFQKAGVEQWKAFVPFYNTWVMQDLAKRPRHWVFWQFIPVVGWFISPGIFIEFVKLFGRFTFWEHTLAALFAPFYFPYLGYSPKIQYIGPEAARKYKKQGWREWVDAAIFAIVAATLIRTFIFEAYTIPSGSMEKTLLINDFLFVSKFAYGPRIPNTPLSIPFIHNYIPGTKARSYTTAVELPYIRWFASPVKRGDVVVFNFPAGDTVINDPDFQSKTPYYDVKRVVATDPSNRNYPQYKYVLEHPDEYPIVVHPADKSDNYIKRCVGIAGDTIQVINNQVKANGQMEPDPPKSRMNYKVTTTFASLDAEVLKDEYDVDFDKDVYPAGQQGVYFLWLTADARDKMLKNGFARQILPNTDFDETEVFPYDSIHKWTRNNFGPIWIPKKGATLTLTPENYSVYERAIRVYEHNQFEMRNGKFLLNGKEVSSYTFKMNYYWMMGDNRLESQDSRYWGFVPEDRIVGRASIIWFSWEGGPRWNRLFRSVK
ncbi:MAG TPA: signal peptidase I [Flavisolibacter sp.]|jgi:signal peptidase I|nr:signal peptidase I [Flavisolibacter sp.]